MTRAGLTPSESDPYRHCAVYLAHGACVCSTGYPSSCTADDVPRCETCGGDGGDPDDAGWSFQGHLEPGSRGPCPSCDGSGRADASGPSHYGWQRHPKSSDVGPDDAGVEQEPLR